MKMLNIMILKYRRVMLITAVISLSMILIKGVTAIAAENILTAKQFSIEKKAYDSCNTLKEYKTELYSKANTVSDEKLISYKEKGYADNLRQMLASITSISIQVISF